MIEKLFGPPEWAWSKQGDLKTRRGFRRGRGFIGDGRGRSTIIGVWAASVRIEAVVGGGNSVDRSPSFRIKPEARGGHGLGSARAFPCHVTSLTTSEAFACFLEGFPLFRCEAV